MPCWPACSLTFVLSVLVLLASGTPARREAGGGIGDPNWNVWDKRSGEPLSLDEIARRFTRRTAGGVHLPIVRREIPGGEGGLQRRQGKTGAIGLGDYVDVAYSVLLTVGQATTPLILDTGSSDLWVMSSSCSSGCGRNVPLYPEASFQPEGLDARLFYGDSTSGTSAFGEIGKDVVDLAGIRLSDQYFAAINRTNTSISRTGSAGIFGLGFPVNSVIWSQLFSREIRQSSPANTIQGRDERSVSHGNIKYGSAHFPDLHNFASRFPSSLPDILSGGGISRRQVSAGMLNVLASFSRLGPFLTRLVVDSDLALPLFTVTLQRNTIDVGGNVGLLSIGEMPPNVTVEELTWVPVRNYSYAEGGLPAPPNSPTEEYPIAWEILIEDVFLDGERLPRSNLSSSEIQLSALVDTGNSLVRGPEDVVQFIYNKLGGNGASASSGRFPCNQPHTLAFMIGGKLFPVDPRDFASQVFLDDVSVCGPNLVPTDPPTPGGYLFGWSLGVPFLKGVLSAYHYGNITYPSRDPPRMGFLSTVPANANDLMQSAQASAARLDNFPMLSAPAPSGTPRSDGTGVSRPTDSTSSRTNAASSLNKHLSSTSFLVTMLMMTITLWAHVW